MESHPSYPVKIKATSLNTVDLIKPDPSGKVLRLDVRAFFKDQERGDNGGVIGVFYTGHIKVTEQFGKIMQGDGEAVAQGTDFGHVREYL